MRIALFNILLLLTISGNSDNHLVLKRDKSDNYGYADIKGRMIIPFGKYLMCFTDTFKKYAIVEKAKEGFVAIDRHEKVYYHIFTFDNGPDYLTDGLYRIVKDGKIGYADSNFSVKIQPQYGCAFPFKNGIAKVSYNCKTVAEPTSEYHTWISNAWFYINKRGIRVKN